MCLYALTTNTTKSKVGINCPLLVMLNIVNNIITDSTDGNDSFPRIGSIEQFI